MKRFIPLILLSLPFTVQAAGYSPQDSVGTRKVNGQVYIEYKVGKGEGLNAICRKYKIKKADVLAANPGMGENLGLDQMILIPISGASNTAPVNKKTNVNETHADADAEKPTEKFPTDDRKRADSHTVKAGETLYKICKQYNLAEADVKKWNNLTDNQVKEGHQLWLKPMDKMPSAPPVVVKKDSAKSLPVITSNTPVSANREPHPMAASVSIKERDESGMARWFVDDELSGGKLLALHKTAPVGTIIRITNKINNKSVFVRVVGTLPDTDENKNLLIKISRTTAEKIGMRDEQTQVKLNYSLE